MTDLLRLPPTVPPERREALQGFAARLDSLMREHGDSQAGLARKIAIAQRSISGYCAGDSLPLADVIVTICRHYNVSADWLLGLTIERQPLATPPAAMIDDDVYRRWLSGGNVSGERVMVPFPPNARLVDAAERDHILALVDAKPTPKEPLWGRLRRRPKKPREGSAGR